MALRQSNDGIRASGSDILPAGTWLRAMPVLERACCTDGVILFVSPKAEINTGPRYPIAARAELMFWAIRCGSQALGTWQFSMSHHTDVFAAAYSPAAASPPPPIAYSPFFYLPIAAPAVSLGFRGRRGWDDRGGNGSNGKTLLAPFGYRRSRLRESKVALYRLRTTTRNSVLTLTSSVSTEYETCLRPNNFLPLAGAHDSWHESTSWRRTFAVCWSGRGTTRARTGRKNSEGSEVVRGLAERGRLKLED